MNVLGLIPARGGSKGVPRKNIKLLNNRPLLAYTAETALQSTRLSRIVLSTDDFEIAEIGKANGIEVPFMRPFHLATDSTPTIDVITHALELLETENMTFDAVCLLQPTNPLRRVEDIDNCIRLLELTQADSVVSILPVPAEYNPNWVYWQNKKGELKLSIGENEPISRRQDLPIAYYRDGSVYVTCRDVLMNSKSLYGNNIQSYEMNPEFSANIDTEEDWANAESRMINNFQIKKAYQ